MLSKEEAINRIKILIQDDCDCEECIKNKEAYKTTLEYIEQLETDKQKTIKKLEERIKSIEGYYEELIKKYFSMNLGIINTSCMSEKEKEEFIITRNYLIVQKESFEEILEILKGEN